MTGLGRLLTVATLPLMVLLIFWASGVTEERPAQELPAGSLVFADLRGSALHVWTLPDGEVRSLRLPGAPHELVLLGEKVYVTLAREDSLLAVYPSAPALAGELPLQGYPHGIATDGLDLYVALGERDRVVRIPPDSAAPAAEWVTGGRPHALTVADGRIWVAEASDGTVRALGSGRPVSVGGLPESIATLADGRLAVADATGAVAVIDPETLEVRRFAVGGRPVRAVGLADGSVAVADAGLMRLVVFDPEQEAVVATVPVGALPDGVCRSVDGEFLAVTSAAAAKVAIFSVRTWEVVLERQFGEGLGSCLWLAR